MRYKLYHYHAQCGTEVINCFSVSPTNPDADEAEAQRVADKALGCMLAHNAITAPIGVTTPITMVRQPDEPRLSPDYASLQQFAMEAMLVLKFGGQGILIEDVFDKALARTNQPQPLMLAPKGGLN
jgi:hypothetical protein